MTPRLYDYGDKRHRGRRVKLGSGVIVATNGSGLELRSIVQPSDYDAVCAQRDELNLLMEEKEADRVAAWAEYRKSRADLRDETFEHDAALGWLMSWRRWAWAWFVLFLVALGAAVWGWLF